MPKTSVIVFRNDLRLFDNPAVFNGVNESDNQIFLYIFDNNSKNKWYVGDAQKWWLFHSLKALDESLKKYGQKLIIKVGDTEQILSSFSGENISFYWNRIYEPFYIQRDCALKQKFNIKSFNASLLYEPFEIKNQTGQPYKVFTHYWKTCLSLNKKFSTYKIPSIKPLKQQVNSETLESLNLLQPWSQKLNGLWHVGENGAIKAFDSFIENGLLHYASGRDIPAKPYVSKLSPHIHFGEISLKYMVLKLEELFASGKIDRKNVDKYIAELGWREFSHHLLYHNPNLPHQNFRPEFNNFPWQENEENFKKWQKGLTGFPIVDAGMRQLWQTGFMHNRTRMIVASFLTKDLLISWQKGAMHFWHCLLDANLANNSASWQWVSGCGADAAPYFRIFNPVMQGEKNDSLGQYVKTYVPELKNIPSQFIHKPWELESSTLKQYGVVLGQNYPKPIVDHTNARNMALSAYQSIKKLDISN